VNPEICSTPISVSLDQNIFYAIAQRKMSIYVMNYKPDKIVNNSNYRLSKIVVSFKDQLFINNYGDIFNNVKIVADPIDTDIFYNQNQEREDKILYVGFMHELKGTLSFFEFAMDNPQLRFVVAGWGTKVFDFLARNTPNVEYLGTIVHEDMPKLFNKYETLFYSPIIPEPFCRSVAEGTLCGIKLMSSSSNIIGCMHEFRELGKEKFIENCKNAPEIFWKSII